MRLAQKNNIIFKFSHITKHSTQTPDPTPYPTYPLQLIPVHLPATNTCEPVTSLLNISWRDVSSWNMMIYALVNKEMPYFSNKSKDITGSKCCRIKTLICVHMVILSYCGHYRDWNFIFSRVTKCSTSIDSRRFKDISSLSSSHNPKIIWSVVDEQCLFLPLIVLWDNIIIRLGADEPVFF